MSAIRLLEKLDKVKAVRGKHPQNWVACCPSHDDKTPSLSISETAEGQVLLHCWSGCRWDEIAESVGLDWDDLFAKSLDRPERSIHPRSGMDVVVDEYCRALAGASVAEAVILFCKAARKNGERLTASDLQREREAYNSLRRAAA